MNYQFNYTLTSDDGIATIELDCVIEYQLGECHIGNDPHVYLMPVRFQVVDIEEIRLWPGDDCNRLYPFTGCEYHKAITQQWHDKAYEFLDRYCRAEILRLAREHYKEQIQQPANT